MKLNKFTIFSIALSVLITQASCLKKQNLEDSNLGPPVAAEKVQDEMLTAFGPLDFDSDLINESNESTFSVTFQDTQKIDINTQYINVRHITGSGTAISFDLDFNYTDHQTPSNSFTGHTVTLTPYPQSKSILKNNLTAASTGIFPKFPIFDYVQYANDICRVEKISCYNLNTVDSIAKLPQELADTRFCENPANCLIPIRKIEMDILDFNNVQSDGKPYRSHIKFEVSSKLPTFSKILTYCIRGLYDNNGQKVPAEQCLVVNSFTVGDAR